jgi:hypothetical protein
LKYTQAPNSCGDFEEIGKINTKTGPVDQLEISQELYKTITDFQKLGASAPEKFSDFLKNRSDVAFFEKVYFIQQYFMDGAAIPYFSEHDLPKYDFAGNCKCKFVFNLSQFAVPGDLNSGIITPEIRSQSKTAMDGDDYNAFWWDRHTKGASKWHQLSTEGSRASGSDYEVNIKMADSSNATYGTRYGQLRYNLFCTNYAEVPADCQCEKALHLKWNYDTEVCAFAQSHSEGSGPKNAVSAAEDIGYTVLQRDNSPAVILGKGFVARAKSECNGRTVNGQFWAKAAKVALNTAGVVFGLAQGDSLSQIEKQLFQMSLNGLTNSITELIGTPYYTNGSCDAYNCLTLTSCNGDTVVFMKPNEPISMFVFSNESLMAGGRKSWFSWSRVLSDFYLAGYVPGGNREGENYCCTDKYANWVLAAATGAPHSTQDLKNEVSGWLSAWNPWDGLPADPFSNLISIPTEYGALVSHVNCSDIGVRSDKNAFIEGDGYYYFSVYDLSGKMIYRASTPQVMPTDLKSYIKGAIPSILPGIYLIEASSSKEHLGRKIFVD